MTDAHQLAEAASKEADELEDANDIEGAIRAMSKAVELAPNELLYLALRGRLYNIREDWRAAVRDFDTVLKAKPKAASVSYSRGRARFMMDDLDGAIDDLQRCIALEPNAADAWGLLGNVYKYRRDWDQALQAYERSHEIDPNRRADLNDSILKMQELIWLRDNGQLEREPSELRTPTAARHSDKKKAMELSDELYEILTHRRQNVTPYQRRRPAPRDQPER